MFEPTNRFMLVDALRPPEGHTLATAVGTTFTLELDALLLATVSFAVFDRLETDDGRPDPIALLESVRRHADNITIFAQAGALSGPRSHPPVLAYLEESVVPVRPARPGYLFHPKVWALKFVTDTGEASYRLLVLSRNLTFDSSWDTIVQLDSKPGKEPRKQHGVVADFLESLPRLAVNALDPARAAQVNGLADELRSVGWENPDGARSVWFHPLGPGFPSPNITGDRVLVMSPFLTEPTVRSLGSGPGADICISRPTSLDAIGRNALHGYADTFALDTVDEAPPPVLVHEGDELDAQLTSDVDVEPPRPGIELSGLHAKVFVTENDGYTRLWLGSANATGAAFEGNVEFLVECRFKSEILTVDRLLDSGEPNLRSLLMPYLPADGEPQKPTELEQVTRQLDHLVRDLSTGRFEVRVSAADDESWNLDLSWPQVTEAQQRRIDKNGVSIMIGPATRQGQRVNFDDTGAQITNATLESITSFLVIEASSRVDGEEVLARSLVNARLTGAPEDRKEQLLARALDDPEKVLRYLLFLLAELTGDSTLIDALGGAGGSFSWGGGRDEPPPILESLLKALAHAPESIGRVAQFITDLRSSPGAELLPQGFEEVWQPINAVREAQT